MKPLDLRFLSTLTLALSLSTAACSAPKAELWERWAEHDPAAEASVDHGPWQRFLERYVRPGADGVHRVDYAGVDDADRRALDAYLEALAATEITSYRRAEQLAYWINLYNALTVRVVLDHLPVDSITEIKYGKAMAFGPWDAKLLRVEGEELSLNDIEHRILRPIWQDPRIHYAVNCASWSCPDLLATAFTAANAEELLERGATGYVNHPRGARFEDGQLVVSSIYEWYKVDFGGSDAGIVAHLKEHAEGELAEGLAAWQGGLRHEYDWSLNAASP